MKKSSKYIVIGSKEYRACDALREISANREEFELKIFLYDVMKKEARLSDIPVWCCPIAHSLFNSIPVTEDYAKRYLCNYVDFDEIENTINEFKKF